MRVVRKKVQLLLLGGALLSGLWIGVTESWALNPGDPVNGKKIYRAFCAGCHGLKGNGQGPAASGTYPHPANFTDPNFWKGKSDAFVINVIENGYNAMPPWWDVITPQEVRDVFSYIKMFKKS